MRKATVFAFMLITACAIGYCEEEKAKEPQALFYTANNDYAARDYAKALAAYNSILNMDLENGALYYNMANSLFKMGKLGYAILFYEKARQLMPQDGDLKSNLSYARLRLGDTN